MAYKWLWINTGTQSEEIVLEEGQLAYAKLFDCVKAAPRNGNDWSNSWGGVGGVHLVIRHLNEHLNHLRDTTAYKWEWIAIGRRHEEIMLEEGRLAYGKVIDCVKAASKNAHEVANSWSGPYLLIRELKE